MCANSLPLSTRPVPSAQHSWRQEQRHSVPDQWIDQHLELVDCPLRCEYYGQSRSPTTFPHLDNRHVSGFHRMDNCIGAIRTGGVQRSRNCRHCASLPLPSMLLRCLLPASRGVLGGNLSLFDPRQGDGGVCLFDQGSDLREPVRESDRAVEHWVAVPSCLRGDFGDREHYCVWVVCGNQGPILGGDQGDIRWRGRKC